MHKGSKHTEEARKRMSKSRTGIVKSKETCLKLSQSLKGHKPTFTGKHSQESIEKMRKAQAGHPGYFKGMKHSTEERLKMSKASRKGPNNPAWKGGVSVGNKSIRRSLEGKIWRDSVYERDDYTDQKTKIRGGEIHAHHIQNFSDHPELRFDINNGITLSVKSHREFHKKYGTKNNTRDQLDEFLLDKGFAQE